MTGAGSECEVKIQLGSDRIRMRNTGRQHTYVASNLVPWPTPPHLLDMGEREGSRLARGGDTEGDRYLPHQRHAKYRKMLGKLL
jgi:hypothetical protein